MLQTAADEEAPTGNNRFEGFCVDLLEQIANQVGFNYQIELVQDNNYGALNLTTGEWNGLVRVCITITCHYIITYCYQRHPVS